MFQRRVKVSNILEAGRSLALENFGVEANPVHQTLKPILAVIGGFLASRPK